MYDDEDDDRTFVVVRNDEEQYSIWPQERDLPPGWVDVGVAGPKTVCLGHIREVWTDLRPKSVRRLAAPAGTEPHVE
ncbi:MbtH family protein [Polymorphospora sp. NPDC050346]|uniref:MbtH family protein n=1 Tax=Polymorphospora sp. NPDC050346 TaxID=3155780 RepID=UPI00340E3B08